MTNNEIYKVLTIGGFDSSGGAGIQADLKTFSALGCYGTTVLTALPVQNTMGVQSVYQIEAACVRDQIKAVMEDISIDSVKIGMLHRQEIVEAVADVLCDYNVNIVLDPVMVAKSGDRLLNTDAIETMKERLFPLTTVLTPNLLEASDLLGYEVINKSQMEKAVRDLMQTGVQSVVVKGGHLSGDCDDCFCMSNSNKEVYWVHSERINTPHTHGTGCTFSAAIASFLAKGLSLLDAIQESKQYLTQAIKAGSLLSIGKGQGPVHHFYNLWQ